MTASHWRLPAEWEPQAAILIAWPHAGTDWAARLPAVEATYVTLAAAITRYQRLLVIVADEALQTHVESVLADAQVDASRVGYVRLPYDDTWLRDSGPITLLAPDGQALLLDFRFTGWGGKFDARQDDALVAGLVAEGAFADALRQRVDWALEGGAIESDGAGSVLSTWRCLGQRHADQPREAVVATLMESLHATRVLWLEHGYLQGDDTDAHIDTLARFAPDGGIVYQACDDAGDPHYAELRAMAAELAALRTPEGRPYRLTPLPWPHPIIDEGRRLAASYANYLVINGAVLVPAYGDAADAEAARCIGQAHPGREVITIPCRSLIWKNGSLN
jgi:agmatine/peptidylarginine deiminase